MVGAGDLGVATPSPFFVVPGVLGRRQLLLLEVGVHLVQPLRDPLGGAAVVDEEDRRGVLADQLQQPRVDRRPDRAPVGGRVERGLDRARVDPLGDECFEALALVRGLARVRAVAALLDVGVGLGHVLDRDDDLEVELLRLALVDELAGAAAADEELPDPLQRALGRRKPDSLNRASTSFGQAARSRSERSSAPECEPRFEGATAWISSTMTASALPRISRACELIIR